ncbi:hypothetical protein [Symbiobacterium terraclitae]|uniref:hypothetical protein n=1 Tax=Symbiobacterium terraclitae TaxID=557451 RepID=UPI0035B549C8
MFYGCGKPFGFGKPSGFGKPGFIGSPFFKKPFFGKGFPATKASGYNAAVPNSTVITTPFPGGI